jgi:uncharacterized protein YggU (UPF0235/DUF167 family)
MAASIDVRVTPRASRDAILGWREGVLRVSVRAVPEKGRANEATEAVVAEALGIAAGRVQVVRGHTVRRKVLEIEGLALEEVRRLLG